MPEIRKTTVATGLLAVLLSCTARADTADALLRVYGGWEKVDAPALAPRQVECSVLPNPATTTRNTPSDNSLVSQGCVASRLPLAALASAPLQ